MSGNLQPFFAPRGVAVVGASQDPAKLGHGLARNLVQCGYRGAIHLVNPKGGRLFDRPIHRDIAEVPDPADLAVILVPAPQVPETLRACGVRGIRAAIVASGGFREIGPEGAALEDECRRIAREAGIRLLGPNCIGVLDTHVPLDTTFLQPPGPLPGEVAFVSHSGAVCAAIIDWMRESGLGLSRLVSLGNQADLTETEVLPAVAADPHTRVITLYLEGVSDGRRFVEEAGRITPRTPIVALKAGRTEAGRRAVTSHTGALAGREAAWDAAFRRSGVIRAGTIEELLDWARALAWCPLPSGREVAVLTNAGGPGVIAADAVEACGLRLAAHGEATQAALRAILPSAASTRNPVDILASAPPDLYARCLHLLLEDPAVSAALVVLPPPPMFSAEAVVEALVPVAAGAKPVVVALMGGDLVRAAAGRLRAARIPDYPTPDRAASALAVLVRRSETLARAVEPKPGGLLAGVGRAAGPADEDALGIARRAAARAVLARARRAGLEWLSHADAAGLLDAYGMRVAVGRVAATVEEAVAVAMRIGFPVALKVASPDLLHKSDAGGVLLDVADARAVVEGFATVCERARQAVPEARIEGVLVQRMIPSGQDLVVGAVQDPQFGPLLMVGSGGVEVEAVRDVAFALAPVSREEAEDLVGRTWAGRRLAGDRGLPAADRDAALAAVVRLSCLAADLPELVEVEVNPLRVLGPGEGAVALDVRARAR